MNELSILKQAQINALISEHPEPREPYIQATIDRLRGDLGQLTPEEQMVTVTKAYLDDLVKQIEDLKTAAAAPATPGSRE